MPVIVERRALGPSDRGRGKAKKQPINRAMSAAQRDRVVTDFALGADPREVAQSYSIGVEHAKRLMHFHEQTIRERAHAFDLESREKPLSDPLQTALDLLPSRAVHREGAFSLDGRPVGAREIIRAANRLLRMRGKTRIPYPGLEDE